MSWMEETARKYRKAGCNNFVVVHGEPPVAPQDRSQRTYHWPRTYATHYSEFYDRITLWFLSGEQGYYYDEARSVWVANNLPRTAKELQEPIQAIA